MYGGGVSVYIGGFSALSNLTGGTGSASAAVGDTVVRNASVRVDAVAFTLCTASCNANSTLALVGNAYGGSFSLYLGGYAWSYSAVGSSSSTSGSTTASGVNVSISDVNSSNCNATTSAFNGANSYGGSMSAVYIGAYTWSFTDPIASPCDSEPSTLSNCSTTDVRGLVVSISSSRLANSSAVSGTFSQCPLVSISLT